MLSRIVVKDKVGFETVSFGVSSTNDFSSPVLDVLGNISIPSRVDYSRLVVLGLCYAVTRRTDVIRVLLTAILDFSGFRGGSNA